MSRPILEGLQEALKGAQTEQQRIAAYQEAVGQLWAAEGVFEDAKHYARVFQEHRKRAAEGAKFWHFLYVSPQDVWYDRSAVIGLALSRAYWLDREPSNMRPEQPACAYASSFKVVKDVTINPGGAYTLVFLDGSESSLSSYDTVCIQLPRRMRDWGIGVRPVSSVAGPIVG